jgi:hypothetical protein
MRYPPHEERSPKNSRLDWPYFEDLRTTKVPTGRYAEKALFKAGMGANRPRVIHCIIMTRVIIAAASCSPAVTSRRTKYDGDFRVQALCLAFLHVIFK